MPVIWLWWGALTNHEMARHAWDMCKGFMWGTHKGACGACTYVVGKKSRACGGAHTRTCIRGAPARACVGAAHTGAYMGDACARAYVGVHARGHVGGACTRAWMAVHPQGNAWRCTQKGMHGGTCTKV